MSTTDIRAAFEVYAKKHWDATCNKFENGDYKYGHTTMLWKAWQAATEAAKATGTAGELPPLPEWSKMDNLGGLVPSEIRQALREYGKQCAENEREACARIAVQWGDGRVPDGGGNALRNYAAALRNGAEAARQPAPVVVVGRVMPCDDYGITIKWLSEMPPIGTDLYTVNKKVALADSEQESFEKWHRSKAGSYPDAHAGWMARAALAATAAPVLSDEQIYDFWLYRDCMDAIRAGDMEAQFIHVVRAILAATNRSQP